ncbi:hypothetical protein O6H91_Y196800 [Diphasiastrum complanatum]|nr:hypothetical protein O6H91_Y196800 [Diphasiastrum complanatum]
MLGKVITESRDASSIFFYVVNEDGGAVNILGKDSLSKGQVPFATGHDVEYGNWELHLKKKTEAQVNFAGIHTSFMHNLTQLVWRKLEIQGRSTGRLQLSDDSQKLANMAIFQITGQLPLELDIVFVSEVQENHSKARVQKISGVGLDNLILEREHAFEKRFQEAFHLKEKIDDERILEVGRAALSNLVGGIGYFHGQSYIAVPSQIQGQDHWNYWSAALYTAVPCRSVFPRGFLWDEGFHQLIISRWDRNISRDIIGNWLDLMNEDGWIPREQILGAEARSKVPEEFILQRTDNANPPTLFLSLHEVASSLVHGQGDEPQRKKEKAFLQRSFPRLQAWFEWLNTTQKGRRLGSYFWHGRELATDRELNPKTLSSGLDDFPRASHPSIDERHLDLRCWMALGAKTMALIARIIGAPYEAYEATSNELASMKELNELHYDSLTGRYYDYGNHSEKVQLQRKFFHDPQTGYVQSMLTRDVLRQPKLQFVPHFGYVSLFPFIMKLIPSDSPILRKQLELIHNEDLLWSDHGLRSLATTSSFYMKHNTEHDPPYWRGSVWINLNYLILSALHHYSQAGDFHSFLQKCDILLLAETHESLYRPLPAIQDYSWHSTYKPFLREKTTRGSGGVACLTREVYCTNFKLPKVIHLQDLFGYSFWSLLGATSRSLYSSLLFCTSDISFCRLWW